MLIPPYRVTPLNKHYEGVYDTSQIEWRRIAAVDKVNNIAALVKDRAISSVLEVGCGTGSVLVEMAARRIGTSHAGVDLADPREHLHPGAEKLDLRAYDGVTLPFPDKSFELVVATHVVEHVPHPRAFLSELRRVAQRYLYVEVPCEMRLYASRAKVQTALDTGHINTFTPESFLILLQTTGLQVTEFDLFDHSREVQEFDGVGLKRRLTMYVRRTMLKTNPLLASRLFCYHCGALAEPH